MNLKPLLRNILYALFAQRVGEVAPRAAMFMDPRYGPIIVRG